MLDPATLRLRHSTLSKLIHRPHSELWDAKSYLVGGGGELCREIGHCHALPGCVLWPGEFLAQKLGTGIHTSSRASLAIPDTRSKVKGPADIMLKLSSKMLLCPSYQLMWEGHYITMLQDIKRPEGDVAVFLRPTASIRGHR